MPRSTTKPKPLPSPRFPWSRRSRIPTRATLFSHKKSPARAGRVFWVLSPPPDRALLGGGIRVASNNVDCTAPASVRTNPRSEDSLTASLPARFHPVPTPSNWSRTPARIAGNSSNYSFLQRRFKALFGDRFRRPLSQWKDSRRAGPCGNRRTSAPRWRLRGLQP